MEMGKAEQSAPRIALALQYVPVLLNTNQNWLTWSHSNNVGVITTEILYMFFGNYSETYRLIIHRNI